MKTKSLDKRANGRQKTNETAGKVKTTQQKACCNGCELCAPGCCGGCCG